MRLLFVCNEYPPAIHGGIGTFMRDLAQGLVKNGHDVTIVGIYEPRLMKLQREVSEYINGVKVVRLPSSSEQFPKRLKMIWDRFRLFLWIRKSHQLEKFDLLESPEESGWLCFGGPQGIPSIIRLHGANIYFDHELQRPRSRLLNLLERISIHRANFLASVSDYVAKCTLRLVNLPSRTYRVIYNAVDVENLKASKKIEDGLIVFANTVIPKKGIEQLIEAFNIVGKKYPKSHLVIIGKITYKYKNYNSYQDYLTQKIYPELTNRVTFTGWLPDKDSVISYLEKAQICCYPSHAEGLGIAPIESMAMAKPTIFMKNGPGPEVIQDNVSGLLCNTRNPFDIAEKLEYVLSNPEIGRGLGMEARKRVELIFSTKIWINENIDFYMECISKYKNL